MWQQRPYVLSCLPGTLLVTPGSQGPWQAQPVAWQATVVLVVYLACRTLSADESSALHFYNL